MLNNNSETSLRWEYSITLKSIGVGTHINKWELCSCKTMLTKECEIMVNRTLDGILTSTTTTTEQSGHVSNSN